MGDIKFISLISKWNERRDKNLYQRFVSFVEDSLLKHGGGITHNIEPL